MKQSFSTIVVMVILGFFSIFFTLFIADRAFFNEKSTQKEVSGGTIIDSKKSVDSELKAARDEIDLLKAKVDSLSNTETETETETRAVVVSDEGEYNKKSKAEGTNFDIDNISNVEIRIINGIAKSQVYQKNDIFDKDRHLNISSEINKLYDIKGLSKDNNNKLYYEIMSLNKFFVDHIDRERYNLEPSQVIELAKEAGKLRRMSEVQKKRLKQFALDLFDS